MTLTTDHPTLQEEENVILIAVMGLTGSGKSTFVKLATGSDEVIVGTELTSCMICDFHCGFSLLNHQGTKKPTLHAFDLSGVKIVLIDTPGFDDTYLSNGDVLQEIAECLKLTYECNMKLTGIIYLHRIMDPRMTQGGMRNLSMFRKLCGSDPMKNVILATTFWGKVTESEGLAREVELQTNPDFWAEMIEEGAQVARLDHTQESTLDLIRRLIKRGKVDLQIQTELCERELPLTQTQAGEQVNRDLADMAKKHAEEIQNLQKEMQDAIKDADKKWELALQKELAKNELKLAKLHEQQAALRDDHRNETRILEQEMDRRWRRELKKMANEKLEAEQNSVTQEQKLRLETKQKADKKAKRTRYVKIAAGFGETALSIAAAVVNPLGAVWTVMSMVQLLNLIFSGSGTGQEGEGYETQEPVE